MKNVTVSLDDETYRRARVKAAQAGRSLSSIVREQLHAFGSELSEFERLHAEEKRLRATTTGFRAAPAISRDDLHDRNA